MLFIVFAIGYLIFSLIDELADRFIYKVKRVSIPIPSEDYKALKKFLKESDSLCKADEWLQLQLTDDVSDFLKEINR